MTLGRPARLLSIQPHMHVRGKSMEVRAIYPDGRAETLLSVPKYDFNWQTTYVLKEPPEPSRRELFWSQWPDSITRPINTFNPDSAATVHWGRPDD